MGTVELKGFNMHQTFDWIFFAIVIPLPVLLLLDLLKNRTASDV